MTSPAPRYAARVLAALALVACLAIGGSLNDVRGLPVERSSALDKWRAPWPEAGPRPGSLSPRRWIVIGWDGASWSVALPLLKAGRLPHLESLMREGSYGGLWTVEPTVSPSIWTTIATGVSPARHGILGFDKPRGPWELLVDSWPGRERGPRRFFSNADRRRKALWNLVTEQGRSVVTVGYHNTFPAERVRGAMLSNYLVQQDVLNTLPGGRSALDPATPFVYPPDLTASLHRWVKAPRDVTLEEAQRFASVDRPGYDALMKRFGEPRNKHWTYLLKTYAYDEFNARAGLELETLFKPDFMLVHFQATDWAGHNYLYFHDPRRFAGLRGAPALAMRLKSEQVMYAGTLAAFYVYVDEWLGRLTAGREDDTAVLVLSDHGMEPDANPLKSGTHNEGPAGLFVMNGPGIRRGHRVDGASVYDVLPTLMATSGLPVAADLEGRVLTEALEPRLVEAGWKRVDTYESGARYRPEVQMDARTRGEVEEELRGLGYIQ
jgi:hypothetical protein